MQVKSIFSFLFSAIAIGAASPSNLPQAVEKVQAAWDKTKTYSANFRQIVTAKRMGSHDESFGVVAIQKPGKIRWETKSEGKIQILNEKRLIHIHIPKRRKAKVVDIYENLSDKVDTRSLSFLSGSDAFKKNYDVNIIKENNKIVTLKFVPQNLSPGDTYIAEFDKSSYLLRSLTTESADTSVRTEFTDVEANLRLSPELFDYKPDPTDVVTLNK